MSTFAVRAKIFFSVLVIVFAVSCGTSSSNQSSAGGGQVQPPPGTVPHIGHVAIMVFENQKYDAVFGNPNMAYLTQLAKDNAFATQFYANTHPSLGNYFMLTAGDIISNDLEFGGVVDQDNIIRQIIKAGKTWKSYQESIPSVGYLDDGPYPYVKGHNPAAYLSDVRNDPSQAQNIVGFPQLYDDLASGNVPDFMFIEPNQINTMHDCPGGGVNCDNDARVKGGDDWASGVVPTIINSPAFKNDGLLIITFDESWDSDSEFGGGHILTVLIGPKVKTGFSTNSFYQHQSLLRTMCDAVGVPCVGQAVGAPPMAEFFVGQ